MKLPTRAERLRAANVREDVVLAAARTAFGRQSDVLLLDLPALLTQDEVVLTILEGRHARSVGLLVLTSRRVLFSPKTARRASALVLAVPDVVDAAGRTSRGMGVLTLTTRAGAVVVDQILGNQADTFAGSVLRVRTDATGRDVRAEDPLTELGQLRALHRAGVIDEAEFRIRKQQLFDEI